MRLAVMTRRITTVHSPWMIQHEPLEDVTICQSQCRSPVMRQDSKYEAWTLGLNI